VKTGAVRLVQTCIAEPAAGARPRMTDCCLCPLQPACPVGATSGPRRAPSTHACHAVAAGDVVYQTGDTFHQLHALRSGTFKSTVLAPDGREQVCGFHLAGDIVGLDGLADGRHQATVVALEDTQTCAIDYRTLLSPTSGSPTLQDALHRLMSREAARGRWHMLQLARMSALERVAAFLIDLSQRASARGNSGRDIHLHMTRRELGSYLGLTLETVSRSLTSLADLRHLEVDNRHVRIRNLPDFLRVFQAQRVWADA